MAVALPGFFAPASRKTTDGGVAIGIAFMDTLKASREAMGISWCNAAIDTARFASPMIQRMKANAYVYLERNML